MNEEFVVRAERAVAVDSPDHQHALGTRRDNSRNRRFNMKLYGLYPRSRRIRILDLGCSGGGFVRDCFEDGHVAVGLEGSSFSRDTRRAEWRTIPERLFTCDISHPFEVLTRSGESLVRQEFDVVTSWEVLEHIAADRLAAVAENVRKHLAPGGLWIVSVCPAADVVDGVNLHQTVQPEEWWIRRFEELGLQNLPEYVRYFNTQFVRGPKYGAPTSFNLVLGRPGETHPPLPRERWTVRVYDRWLHSAPQRILRKLVAGID